MNSNLVFDNFDILGCKFQHGIKAANKLMKPMG